MTSKEKFILKRKRKYSIKQLGMSFLLLCLFGSSQIALAQQNPEVTLRFNNPVLDCNTGVYCLDVEYRADVPDREVFGTNVRFFYNDDVMEFIDIRDFQGGYSLVAPFPTREVASGLASAFGYSNSASLEYINANIQLTNSSAPSIVLPSDGSWVKLFQVCFQVIEDEISDLSSFCPSVIWDLEQDPNDEGYQPASQGPVTTLVDPNVSGASTAASERVEQFNWVYTTGSGFGEPQFLDCLDLSCLLPDNPELTLLKEGTFADDIQGDGFAQVGETINYVFTVENTGDVTIDNLRIDDTRIGASNLLVNPSTLLPGEMGVADFSYTITQADVNAGGVYNIATVTGNDQSEDDPVTDQSEDPNPLNPTDPFYNPDCPDCTFTELLPPPPPPTPVNLPALSAMYKIMLGAVLMGLVILVGFNRKVF